MKLLLDTHVVLWWYLDDRRVSAAARALIEDPAKVKFVSPASHWEVAIKIRIDRRARGPLRDESDQLVDGLELVDQTFDAAQALVSMPDPACRHS